MAAVSKILRVGAVESSSRGVSPAASKPKAKKGYTDEDYHGYFFENGAIRQFTTYRGVRYVHPQYVVVRKSLTTMGSGLRGA